MWSLIWTVYHSYGKQKLEFPPTELTQKLLVRILQDNLCGHPNKIFTTSQHAMDRREEAALRYMFLLTFSECSQDTFKCSSSLVLQSLTTSYPCMNLRMSCAVSSADQHP